jgi:CheY-like chemotaxis protein
MLSVVEAMFEPLSDTISLKTAASGAQALRMCEVIPFDLVVTDVMMDGMNGVELAERVIKKFCIPVILASGYDIRGVVPEEPVEGMVCCLSKPFGLKKIRDAIITVFDNSRECVKRCREKHLQQGGI